MRGSTGSFCKLGEAVESSGLGGDCLAVELVRRVGPLEFRGKMESPRRHCDSSSSKSKTSLDSESFFGLALGVVAATLGGEFFGGLVFQAVPRLCTLVWYVTGPMVWMNGALGWRNCSGVLE